MTNHKPQLPPCDLDAERCVLASILVDGDALRPSFKACSDASLDAKAFLEPKHQTIYQACQQLITQGISPDELTLSNQLRNTLTLDQAGGLHYINELTSSIFAPSANLRQAIIILQEKHQARQLINLARDISAKAQSGAFKPDELMQSLMAQAKDISTTSSQDSTTVQMPLADLYNIDRHNDPNNLLGNRWICKGGSLLFSAQAGCGKSTLATQMIVSWALGRDLWHIKPVRPLRIVLLQSENDLADLAEQWQDVTASMSLSRPDLETLAENVSIYREAIKTGDAFGLLIEDLVKKHRADLLIIDPLLGFAAGDVSKQEYCSHFLRHILQPCLMRTGCALIAIHHQNKPPKKSEGKTSSTYDFSGSSELANWFRATAILRREDDELPHFIFKLGKRGSRAGMRDLQGFFTESLRVRHSKIRGQIKWEINNAPPPQDNDV
jgi:hypothetical protein